MFVDYSTTSGSCRTRGRKPEAIRPRFELLALDPGKVAALDPDELSVTVAPRRMQHALIVDVRNAGGELIVAHLLDLAGHAAFRLLEKLPVGHHRDTFDLAVDRPARAMVVRRTDALALVDVGQDTEFQIGILVEDLAVLGVALSKIFATKSRSEQARSV